MVIRINAPVLNISAYKSKNEDLGGQKSYVLRDSTWSRGNQTFGRAYMELNGKCQNAGVG